MTQYFTKHNFHIVQKQKYQHDYYIYTACLFKSLSHLLYVQQFVIWTTLLCTRSGGKQQIDTAIMNLYLMKIPNLKLLNLKRQVSKVLILNVTNTSFFQMLLYKGVKI